jgi:hypothetical protein
MLAIFSLELSKLLSGAADTKEFLLVDEKKSATLPRKICPVLYPICSSCFAVTFIVSSYSLKSAAG